MKSSDPVLTPVPVFSKPLSPCTVLGVSIWKGLSLQRGYRGFQEFLHACGIRQCSSVPAKPSGSADPRNKRAQDFLWCCDLPLLPLLPLENSYTPLGERWYSLGPAALSLDSSPGLGNTSVCDISPVSYLTPLGLSLLICKMGLKVEPAS